MQEKQDDQDGKYGAEEGRVLQRGDRVEDEAALLEGDAELHRRIALPKLVDLGVDAAGNRDDVGVGLRVDVERERRRIVEPRELALLLDIVPDGRDVAHIDRGAVADGDHDIAHLGCVGEQGARAHEEFARPTAMKQPACRRSRP